MSNEARSKAELVKKLKRIPYLVVLRHEDEFTAGIPDISISLGDRTLWLEIKRVPYKLRELQHYTLQRLARSSSDGKPAGYYVIYDKTGTKASIVPPDEDMIHKRSWNDRGHDVVIEFVRDWMLKK